MDRSYSTSIEALPDTGQTAWQLAAIQLGGWTSLPILATSLLVLRQNSFLGAVATIIVGNGILWFIRLGIILMSYRKRQSTLDISRDYLGDFGSYFIAPLLLISTLVWFIAQTSAATHTLTQLVTITEDANIDRFAQMSVLLGIISTFLCMEGIVALRKLSTLAFPILVIAFVLIIFSVPFQWPEGGEVALSLSGLSLVMGTNLGLTSDIPTFFRHSKSLQTSIKALTIIQLVSLALGLCSLYFGSIIGKNFIVNQQSIASGNDLFRIALVAFVFFSAICANVANVYSASVGWELIAPAALVGRKEYLILGLGLTTTFILIADIFPINFLLNISDSALVNLCVVLVIGYIISRWKRRSPSSFEQISYFSAWSLATIANALQFFNLIDHASSLVMGLAVITFTLLFFFGAAKLRRLAKV